MPERIHYKVQISNDTFSITEEQSSSAEKKYAASTLKKIKTILTDKLKCADADKNYMNMPKELMYIDLRNKAKEIKTEHESGQKGFFNWLFGWLKKENRSVSKNYYEINHLTHEALSQPIKCITELDRSGNIPKSCIVSDFFGFDEENTLIKINEVLQNPEQSGELKQSFTKTLLNKAKEQVFDKNGKINQRSFTEMYRQISMQSIEFLIDHGADINHADENGMTILAHACKSGNKELVELLIAKGADQSKADKNGNTPLHHTAFTKNIYNRENESKSRTEIAELLSKSQAGVKNRYGLTPLDYACESIQSGVAKALIPDSHAEDIQRAIGITVHSWVKNEDIGYHQKRFCDALERERSEILKRLLEHPEIDINKKVEFKECESPIRDKYLLHLAIESLNADAIEQLISHEKCNFSLQDSQGNTPLHLAVRYKHYFNPTDFGRDNLFDLLKKNTNDLNTVNKEGLAPQQMTSWEPPKKVKPSGGINPAFYYKSLEMKSFLPEP